LRFLVTQLAEFCLSSFPVFKYEVTIKTCAFLFCRYRGSEKLENCRKYEIVEDNKKYAMVIKNMTEEDVGEYRVVAGPHSAVAQLKLIEDAGEHC